MPATVHRDSGRSPRRAGPISAAVPCLLAIACICMPAFAAGEGRMIKYSTPEVRLYTDIGKHEAKKVQDSIAFYDEYLEEFFKSYGFSSRKKNPVRCRLFAQRQDFNEHRRKTDTASYASAYFSQADNCIVAAYDGGAKGAMQTLVHEVAHVIHRRYIPNLVPWIDEGLATYFEATDFDPHRNVISACAMGRLEVLRGMISDNRLMDWKTFFEIQNYQLDLDFRQGRRNAAEFYAQAWGVVYFYLHSDSKETRDLFTRFMKGMRTGRERSTLILRDMAKREQEFRSFIMESGHNAAALAYRDAARLRREEEFPEALQRLQPILTKDPHHAAALRLAAETAWDGGLFDKALEYWRRLAAGDEKNTTYMWKICRSLTELGLSREDRKTIDESVEAGKEAVRATRKQDPDALAALAMAYHAQGDTCEALATIRKAVRFKCDSRDDYKALEERYAREIRKGE